MFCTRLANGGLFPTGDPIVPFVISPRFECLNKLTHPLKHTHCTHGTCGVLHCLLFCDQTRPNLRISLVGYYCAIEFPCGVPLFYCCKYPTTYGVRVQTCKHRQTGSSHCSSFVYTLLFIHFRNTSHMFCTRLANGGLFPTGDPIVPFVISPRFECLNKLTHTDILPLSNSKIKGPFCMIVT